MQARDVPLGVAFLMWCQRRASVAELEAEHLVEGVPFGAINGDWENLKAQIQPDDEFWVFCSPQEEWDRFMGWEGILLLRSGGIVDFLITAQN